MTNSDFMATIIAAPADDAPRLVFADVLEEHGEPERGEFIRVQCELARMPSREPTGNTPREVDARWDEHDAKIEALRSRERAILDGDDWIRWQDLRNLCDVFQAADYGPNGCYLVEHVPQPTHTKEIKWQFRRGFVESITCTWSDFLTHHAAIRAETPLREVTLTTQIPWRWMWSTADRLGLDWRPGDEWERWDRVLAAEFQGLKFLMAV